MRKPMRPIKWTKSHSINRFRPAIIILTAVAVLAVFLAPAWFGVSMAQTPPGMQVTVTRPATGAVSDRLQKLVVSWTDVQDATSYNVQWKSGNEAYHSSRQHTVTDNDPNTGTYTQDITGLQGGTDYTVRVVVVLIGGEETQVLGEQTTAPWPSEMTIEGDTVNEGETAEVVVRFSPGLLQDTVLNYQAYTGSGNTEVQGYAFSPLDYCEIPLFRKRRDEDLEKRSVTLSAGTLEFTFHVVTQFDGEEESSEQIPLVDADVHRNNDWVIGGREATISERIVETIITINNVSDLAPSFGSASASDRTYVAGTPIMTLTLPAATRPDATDWMPDDSSKSSLRARPGGER